MKYSNKVIGAISFAIWLIICIGAAKGYMRIDKFDYCIASGLLALHSLFWMLKE